MAIKHIVLLIALSIFSEFAGCLCESFQAIEDTRKLLTESPRIRDDSLATLFRIGDERIQELTRALDDPNEVVRLNAQIVIRYLGNETGMKALIEHLTKSRVFSLAGAVPLPLREWDYEYIRRSYLERSSQWDFRSTSYIYALALDDSPKAKALLNDLSVNGPYHYAFDRVKTISANNLFLMKDDLAKVVINNAFFLNSDDREQASAKILGFNHTKDKCLIAVYVSSGSFTKEIYHIVLEKQREGWKFFSVTPISVS
jgi:hypothetical protein